MRPMLSVVIGARYPGGPDNECTACRPDREPMDFDHDDRKPKPNTMSKRLSFIGDPSRSDASYQWANQDKQPSTSERMSVRTQIIVITILVGFAILHVIGSSLITSIPNRPMAERAYLSGAD
jgi:hypothetical protein